jgi:hypothetical protein
VTFAASDFERLPRDARRQLVQLLVRESGLSLIRDEPYPEYDDLVFERFPHPDA